MVVRRRGGGGGGSGCVCVGTRRARCKRSMEEVSK